MRRIDNIKYNKANTIAKVTLDDGEELELTAESVCKARLVIGGAVDEELLERASGESDDRRAFDYLVDYLSKFPTSEKKARLKLKTKGYNQGVIDSAIAKAIEYSYINDVELANMIVTCYGGKYSKRQIKDKLVAAGIPSGIMYEILESVGEDDQYGTALNVALLWGRYKDIEDSKFKEKYMRYMSSKGYSWEIIYKVYPQLLKELTDEE